MENQEKLREVRSEERKVPVFTVLKNNAILKNIFLLNNPEFVEREFEEILVVGRHPDCNITLEHPSISRFHLRIHSNPSSRSLSVVDLSSVHGTWIAGKKIESGVRVELKEGDTMKLGGSSRLYRLHWIPLSRAYDSDNPFVPPIQEPEPVKEGEGETYQVDDGLLHEDEETLAKNDDSLNSDEDMSEDIVSLVAIEEQVDCKSIEEDDSLNSDEDVDIVSLVANEEQVDCKSIEEDDSLNSDEDVSEDIVSFVANEEQVDCESIEEDDSLNSDEDVSEDIVSLVANEEQVDCKSIEEDEINKENSFSESSFAQIHSRVDSQTGNMSSVLIQTERDPRKSSSVQFGSEIISESNADSDIHSFSEDIFSSDDVGEKMLTPEEENHATSPTIKSSVLKVDEGDDEIFTPDKENETMDSHLLSEADTDRGMFTPDKEALTPNKENQTPGSVLVCSLFDLRSASTVQSLVDEDDDKTVGDKKNVTLDSLPLSGSVDEEMFTTEKENLINGSTVQSSVDEDYDKAVGDKKNVTLDSLPLSGSVDEEMFTTENENLISGSTMKSSLSNVDEVGDEMVIDPKKEDEEEIPTPGTEKTGEVDLKRRSTVESLIPNMDDETFLTPIKENVALDSSLRRSIKQKGKLENIMKLAVLKPSPLRTAINPWFCRGKGKRVPLANENSAEKAFESSGESFTPNKENMTPNTHFLWSMNKTGKVLNEDESLCSVKKIEVHKPLSLEIGVEEEHRDENVLQEQIAVNAANVVSPRLHQCESMSVKRENHTEKVLQDQILMNVVARDPKDRVPLQTLIVNSNIETESIYSSQDVSAETIHHSKYSFSAEHNIVREENKRWCMVVDTTTLLNKDSRKALQLLQGLKWTSLIVPRIVIRELDCMKRCTSFFRRATEVCSALEWIEDCMRNSKSWIRVQSSEEESRTIPPTPPATPAASFTGDGLMDIISPTAEDHILEYALSCRKIYTSQRLVLLSDDVTLKIKSMAEGLLCETAADFRESLVNPCSERFLWTESSPRGTTWSSADDVLLKEMRYHCPLKKHSRLGESARGLKLILLHNPHYRQLSSLNKN